MRDGSLLAWPFFDDSHRALAEELERWKPAHPIVETDAGVRALAQDLRDFLRYAIPKAQGGMYERLDVRSLCLIREHLSYTHALADFTFAMQGLGSGAISLFGDETLKSEMLPRVAGASAIAAFALSEREAGSDVAALTTVARHDGETYTIDGEKTWISNAGVADFYVVFARTGGAGSKGLSAFVVDAQSAGLDVTERIETLSPHPLGTVRFTKCRVPDSRRLGAEGDGFKIAMATLDIFRSTVGAAALGFARRALDETIAHVRERKIFGGTLGSLQMTQATVADMATDVDASALLVYRAAWTKDRGAPRVTREAAMAKLFATEAAGRVVDSAVQLFGGRGVRRGEIVEALYRDVRALRIYEGASEIQRVVIARATFESGE